MGEFSDMSACMEAYHAVSDEYPPQSAEEERAMVESLRNTDRRRLNDLLVLHNLRLVFLYAGRYDYHKLLRYKDREDSVQDGIVGLIHAAETFDPDKGVRFSTHAGYHIRRAMQYDTVLAARRIDDMTQASMDDPVKAAEDGDTSVGELVGGIVRTGFEMRDWTDAADARLDLASLPGVLREGSRPLTDREVEILFKSCDADRVSRREIGLAYGVSHQRVKQLFDKAVRKIRLRRDAALCEYTRGSSGGSRGLVSNYSACVQPIRGRYRRGGTEVAVEWRISGGGGAYFWDLRHGRPKGRRRV